MNIQKQSIQKLEVNYDYLYEQARKIDLDSLNFENEDYNKLKTKIEKQKVYFWIRVYLSEEIKIEPGDGIIIKYIFSGEELDSTFICYAKKGASAINYVDGEPVVNYNSEDDTKVLCLMVDEEKINNDSDDIPFLRKLFKIGRHFEYVLLKRTDLTLTNSRTNEQLKYYDIEF